VTESFLPIVPSYTIVFMKTLYSIVTLH